MSVSVILQQMGVIVILVAIGIYLYKRGTIDNVVSQRMSAIVVDICNPALILASILSGNVVPTHKEMIEAVVIGAAFYAVLMILGFVIPHILRAPKDERRFYNMMVVYTNIGFIGIPVAKAILPDKAIIYVVVCNVMYAFLFYTHGIVVLSKGKEKMNILKVFSPGTIMAVLALIVCWFKYTPPQVISGSISYIGNATVFLSMTLLGVSIARSDIIKGFKVVRVWGYILIRMILLPVAVFFILRAMNIDKIAVLSLCLMAAMPVGNLPLIQSEKMGEDTSLLSSAITVSTIVSIGSITGLMVLFTSII